MKISGNILLYIKSLDGLNCICRGVNNKLAHTYIIYSIYLYPRNYQDTLPSPLPPVFMQIMFKQKEFGERKIHGVLIHCLLSYFNSEKFNDLIINSTKWIIIRFSWKDKVMLNISLPSYWSYLIENLFMLTFSSKNNFCIQSSI